MRCRFPARVALRAEEIGPQVVVHAMDLPILGREIRDDLGADEPRTTGDDQSTSHGKEG